MDTNISLALVALGTVFLTGLVTPIAVGYAQYRIRKAERLLDRREQLEVKEALVQRADIVDSKLDSIHGFVNSQMGALLNATLEALNGQRILLFEKQLEKPSDETLVTIDVIDKKIIDLRNIISDREKP